MARLITLLIFASLFNTNTEAKKMKNALLVIPSQNFRDEELFDTQKVLVSKGIKVTIASTTLDDVVGTKGGKAKPDVLIQNAKVNDYDAIVLIGGGGAAQYWDDKTAHMLVQNAYKDHKVVGAICIAPVTLARAGILKNKKFTVWVSEVKTIEKDGGIYSPDPVVVDGKIVTGNGPAAAEYFGKKIAELM